VGEDERDDLLAVPSFVDEMDRDPIDVRTEVVELFDRSLLHSPVEAVEPVADELTQVRAGNAVAPGVVLEVVRPACAPEALVEIVDLPLPFKWTYTGKTLEA
jgi:hypothetical protein